MDGAWQILLAAGVPDGAIRVAATDDAPSDATVAAALGQVLPGAIGPRRAEPLVAWLSAFRHHWPLRFERVLGDAGRDALAQLRRMPLDRGRYLKLRRIAIENLAARWSGTPSAIHR